MARAINRITAVLAGGIPQHVTRGCTEFGRLRQVWLTPLPLPVVPSRGLSPRCHCFFGKLIGTDAGAGCSGEWFSWGEVDDRQRPRWEEREREEQHSIQRLGAPVGKGGKERGCLLLRNGVIFPSLSWILKLQTPKVLWIYAFTDRSGPDIEIKAAVELQRGCSIQSSWIRYVLFLLLFL